MNNTLRFLIAIVAFCSCSTLFAQPNQQQVTMFSSQQLKDDFTFLYQTLAASQYNLFYNTPKHIYDAEFATRLRRLDHPMSTVDAYKHFQQFMALAKIAHTRIDSPVARYKAFIEEGGKTFPIYLSIREGEVFVDEYYGGNKQLKAGNQIEMVNGTPVLQWLAPLFSYLSADDEQIVWSLAGSQIPSLLWLHEGEKDSYSLTIKIASSSKTIDIETLSKKQQKANAENTKSVESSASPLREQKMIADDIAYLKPGPFYNVNGENIWDTTSFIEFIDAAFNSFNQAKAKALLIDIRDNPGGTNSFSDPLIAWFADEKFRFASDFRVKVSQPAIDSNNERLKLQPDNEVSILFAKKYATLEMGEIFSFEIPFAKPIPGKRFSGEVFILIDRHSYSNAVSVAAIAKDYGFATLLGEKTADFATTFGAMEHFTLPETGFTVGFPKALIVRPNGDTSPGGVSPDIEIDMKGSKEGNSDYGITHAVAIIKSKLMETSSLE